MSPNEEKSDSLSTLGLWSRGLFMGVADVVPGFSGGTVALITGIYERLITSISRFDSTAVQLLFAKKFKELLEHIDFWFLLKLGTGIVSGFVITLLTVHKLLDSPVAKPYVLAAFLGMVLGSSWFVLQMIRQETKLNWKHLSLALLGVSAALTICLIPPTVTSQPPLYFVFLCGAIAICAMILPGISGALILMILGTYKFFTGIAKELIHLENVASGLTTSVVFGMGCLTGLFCFSRLLKFLFRTRPAATLSVLFGLMLGSTIRLWPFRLTEVKEIEGIELEIDSLLGPSLDLSGLAYFATMLIAAGVVFVIGIAGNPVKINHQ